MKGINLEENFAIAGDYCPQPDNFTDVQRHSGS
jgi:hypothetical protein